MHDAGLTPPKSEAQPPDRRSALALLALLLAAPLLVSCKDVAPGSGVETIRQSRERSPPSGR